MEVVVWLALLVLSVVFILSSCLLVVLCKRRKQQLAQRNQLLLVSPNLRFSRLRNDDHVDSFLQLSPLLDGRLEEEWQEGAQEAYEHIVAVLKLACMVVKKLAEIDLSKCPPRIYQLICEAMPRVRPHFEDLVSFHPISTSDMKVVEARATTLATVCWSLILPFTLVAPEHKEELQSIVHSMYEHIDSLREQLLYLEMQFTEPAEEDDGDTTQQTVITHEQLPQHPNNTNHSSPNHPVDPAN